MKDHLPGALHYLAQSDDVKAGQKLFSSFLFVNTNKDNDANQLYVPVEVVAVASKIRGSEYVGKA